MEFKTKKKCPHCSFELKDAKYELPKKSIRSRGGNGHNLNIRKSIKCSNCTMLIKDFEMLTVVVTPQEQYDEFLKDVVSRGLLTYSDIGWPTIKDKALDFINYYEKSIEDFNADLRIANDKFNLEMMEYFKIQE